MHDAMEEIRQRREESNARLLRYEMLGVESSSRPSLLNVSYSPFCGSGWRSSILRNDSSRNSGSDRVVNLEYLNQSLLPPPPFCLEEAME
ncbi:hypothetical protein ACHAWF_008237 [Thalassiosira exigua]